MGMAQPQLMGMGKKQASLRRRDAFWWMVLVDAAVRFGAP